MKSTVKKIIKKFLKSLAYLFIVPTIMILFFVLLIMGTLFTVIGLAIALAFCPIIFVLGMVIVLADVLTLGQLSICEKIFMGAEEKLRE